MSTDRAEGQELIRALLRWLWLLVQLPVLMLLVILEPVVAIVLGGLALAGVITTFFLVLIHAPNFPAWTMLLVSGGFGLALVAYNGLLALLSR